MTVRKALALNADDDLADDTNVEQLNNCTIPPALMTIDNHDAETEPYNHLGERLCYQASK